MAYAVSGAQWASDHPEVPWRPELAPSIQLVASTTQRRPGRLRRSLPRPLCMLVVGFLIALLLPMALPAAPATAAASCGTNWTSYRTPPKTIRVLLADKGRVVVAQFRSYVAMVMASGEFPTWLPPAVLQTGATAVKQYGWYYAMKGHHRSNYRTASGVCYDVRNDTNDQLFHSVAHPTQKQLTAVDATWGLTLRKGSRFFLTGYRAGVASKCAADADGWRIYAKSMVDCASKGWTRQQIQQRYYAPRISFIWRSTPPPPPGDSTPPTVAVPEVTPSTDQPNRNSVRVTVTWSATDDKSGVASYHLQERVGAGTWHAVQLSGTTATSVQVDTKPGVRHQFRLKARDKAGNATGWIQGVGFVPQVSESDGAQLHGSWAVSKDSAASGGQTRTTTQKGARASLSFRGSAVGVMASLGPNMGQARISIDGVVVDVIDLNSSSPQDRRVIFSRSWPTRRNHTITVEALGTGPSPRIDVDAFVLLR